MGVITPTFLHCRDARRKVPVRERALLRSWVLHPDRQPKITQGSRKMEGTTMGKFKGH